MLVVDPVPGTAPHRLPVMLNPISEEHATGVEYAQTHPHPRDAAATVSAHVDISDDRRAALRRVLPARGAVAGVVDDLTNVRFVLPIR